MVRSWFVALFVILAVSTASAQDKVFRMASGDWVSKLVDAQTGQTGYTSWKSDAVRVINEYTGMEYDKTDAYVMSHLDVGTKIIIKDELFVQNHVPVEAPIVVASPATTATLTEENVPSASSVSDAIGPSQVASNTPDVTAPNTAAAANTVSDSPVDKSKGAANSASPSYSLVALVAFEVIGTGSLVWWRRRPKKIWVPYFREPEKPIFELSADLGNPALEISRLEREQSTVKVLRSIPPPSPQSSPRFTRTGS